MQKVYHFSIRSKIIADLAVLASIILILQSIYFSDTQFLSSTNISILFFSLGIWLFSARTSGLYNDFREKPFSIEWIAFLKSLVLYGLLVSFLLLFFYKDHLYNRPLIVLHCSLIFVLIPVQKVIIRIALKKLSRSNNVARKVLIVGARETGFEFYQQYVRNQQYGYKLTGFVDEEKHPSLNGHYLGKATDIERVIAKHDLDDIIVTLPITNEKLIDEIVAVGEREGKRIRIIPDFQRFGSGKLHYDQLGSFPIITLRSLPLDLVDNRIYKRIFDVFFSLVVILFIFSWLFPIIALIIKLASKGPVFFKQERWGLNNKPITCYKFRSMVAASKDVDENGNYLQASKNDPRITRIGAFLRKSNLDELPQFFNVLFGSMSVVGPRPHPVPLNLQSKGHVDNYMKRLWVKPGITGWAQVNGYRGETKNPFLMQKRVELDMWYIENWKFLLDLQIILQTLVNMVKGEKNAF
jgi:putative colanic acid biosysnthesis UDP-glucose lipid carrier transferase